MGEGLAAHNCGFPSWWEHVHSRVWTGKVLCRQYKKCEWLLLYKLQFTNPLNLLAELRCLNDMFLKPKLQEILGQDRWSGHSMSGIVICSGHISAWILTLDGNRKLVFKSAEASGTPLKADTNNLL